MPTHAVGTGVSEQVVTNPRNVPTRSFTQTFGSSRFAAAHVDGSSFPTVLGHLASKRHVITVGGDVEQMGHWPNVIQLLRRGRLAKAEIDQIEIEQPISRIE